MPKKPKLTPEERKKLKAEKKAEKKRLAELKKRQLRHDHLSREIKYGQLTVKLHERNWKKMLVSIALPRLREDLQFAWHNFERVIDAKDFTISLLLDEINDAEEQYMMNLRHHVENIDDLIYAFRDRLESLRRDHEIQLENLQTSADKEIEDIRSNAADSEEYLKTMLFGLGIARKEQEKLVRGEYLSKLDEETTKYSDIIQSLKIGLENNFNRIWEETKAFLKSYADQTGDRRKEYNILSQQDAALQKLCSEQRLKLQTMQDIIKKLKSQFSNLQESQGQKISDLLQERQYFADAFLTLRNRLETDKNLDKLNLQILTVESNESTNYLEKIEKKGEKILEMAAICRKLETKEEKILPFPLPYTTSEVETTYSNIRLNEYKNTADLYLFWQRVAQVDASRHSINEEREFLKRENKILKIKIHEFCQCLDCPAFLESHCKKKGNLKGKINVVDGNIVQKNYSYQQL